MRWRRDAEAGAWLQASRASSNLPARARTPWVKAGSAAISKAVRERQERFNLPDNQFNKSAEACERYRMGNKRRAGEHAA